MIMGIGTDICDIRRIEKLIEEYGDKFTKKTFTKKERERADGQSMPAASYAKRFAAKEAAAKALAGRTTGALSWQDVEVINESSGKPKILLHRGALERVKEKLKEGQKFNIHLSLSDDFPYATAYVIVEIL